MTPPSPAPGPLPREFTVRPLRLSDLAAFRELRLQALATDPSAFGSTWARESKDPDSRWEERVHRTVGSTTEALWVAESPDGSLLGMLGMFVEEGRDHAHLWGMWVRPEHRRRGVGAALLDSLLAHADKVWKTPELKLDANPSQEAAVRLYRSRGFVPTGRTQPLGHREGELIEEWVRRSSAVAP
jgi:ribosomal protein S18 acetylase RimI-like enzyme